MEIQFVMRQFDASDALKALIQEKVDKHLEPVVWEGSEVKITLAQEKSWTIFDVMVISRGETFKSSEKTTDLYPIIDTVIEKVARQISKKKEMVRERRTRKA